jgi:hypothetical protein
MDKLPTPSGRHARAEIEAHVVSGGKTVRDSETCNQIASDGLGPT